MCLIFFYRWCGSENAGTRKYLDSCVKDSQNVIKWHLRQEEMVNNPSLIRNSNWTESREADLKLRARLLPELYDTRSNY